MSLRTKLATLSCFALFSVTQAPSELVSTLDVKVRDERRLIAGKVRVSKGQKKRNRANRY